MTVRYSTQREMVAVRESLVAQGFRAPEGLGGFNRTKVYWTDLAWALLRRAREAHDLDLTVS